MLLFHFTILLFLNHLFSNAHPTSSISRSPGEPRAKNTQPPALAVQIPACQIIGAALATCASISPNFESLPAASQAPCLCYSSGSWGPQIFDNAIKTCADFSRTAIPGIYPLVAGLEDFCENIGDIQAVETSTSISSSVPANDSCVSKSYQVQQTSYVLPLRTSNSATSVSSNTAASSGGPMSFSNYTHRRTTTFPASQSAQAPSSETAVISPIPPKSSPTILLSITGAVIPTIATQSLTTASQSEGKSRFLSNADVILAGFLISTLLTFLC